MDEIKNDTTVKTGTTTQPFEKKEGFMHKVGDAIEKLGDKVEHGVNKKLGDAIEKFGDKVEHSRD